MVEQGIPGSTKQNLVFRAMFTSLPKSPNRPMFTARLSIRLLTVTKIQKERLSRFNVRVEIRSVYTWTSTTVPRRKHRLRTRPMVGGTSSRSAPMSCRCELNMVRHDHNQRTAVEPFPSSGTAVIDCRTSTPIDNLVQPPPRRRAWPQIRRATAAPKHTQCRSTRYCREPLSGD